MNNVVDFSEFKTRRNRTYYRNLFIEKYLYVKKNMGLIKNVTFYKDPTGLLFYQVLESLLLENNEIELTNGKKIIDNIINNYNGDFINNLDSFYENIINLGLLCFDDRNDLKYRLIVRYLCLNDLVDASDNKTDFVKNNLLTFDSLIDDNDFIENCQFCCITDEDVYNLKNECRKGKENENKRY